jgi:hypothetical protein
MKLFTEKEAEKKYNDILKNTVYPLTGNKTTYGNVLEEIAKKIFGKMFHGVYPSDQIPSLSLNKKYAILNLDSSDMGGSHWVAVARDKNDILIYDSFGRKAKKIIPSLTNSTGKIINTDLDAEQKIEETDCGARCIAWLIFFHKYGRKNAILI